MTRVSDDGARRTGPALEAMYQLVKWLVPSLDRFPRSRKFLLGDRIRSTAPAGLETLVEATFPEDNVRRFRNRLRSMRDRLRAGAMAPEEARPRIASWVAHARHANTRRLRRALLRGGPFGPAAHRLSGHPAPPGRSGSLAGP